MRIWTIQNDKAWEMLQRRGALYGSKSYIDKDFIDAYRWMRQKMKKFIDFDAADNMWPIWGWVQYDSRKRPMPDLRCSWHLPRGTHGVRLCLDLPAEKMLISDFLGWHDVLNAPGDYGNDFWLSAMDPRLDKKWENKILYTQCEKRKLPDRSLQCTFWSISMDDIKDVKTFVAV